jgi:cytoplasmic iron level regulating protein YaaA (DUF328/UPF0246 family)
MKILLSPAKSLQLTDNWKAPLATQACFLEESEKLIKKLQKLSTKKIAKLMTISTDLAELNHTRFNQWIKPLEVSENIIPAIFAFNGEVYKGFDASSLTELQLIRAQESVYILSGLYGLLKPLDLLYPYRLEMGTKWQISTSQKNLYDFWKKKLTNHLKSELAVNETIVNLASTEYSKAIDFKLIKNKMVTPQFKEFKNGDFKVVMMYAKHARGAMARYIVQKKLNEIEELKLYNVDGYSYDEKQSTETEWVFVR